MWVLNVTLIITVDRICRKKHLNFSVVGISRNLGEETAEEGVRKRRGRLASRYQKKLKDLGRCMTNIQIYIVSVAMK